MSLWLRHLLGLAHCRPPFARRPRSREPGSASATIDAPCQTASSTARDLRQVVLVALRRAWSGWKRSLILVMPETVVRWHRAGFRLYWSWIWRARKAVGRKPISREVRDLISAWSLRTRRGEHLASTGSCSSWVSKSQNEPFLAGKFATAILFRPPNCCSCPTRLRPDLKRQAASRCHYNITTNRRAETTHLEFWRTTRSSSARCSLA